MAIKKATPENTPFNEAGYVPNGAGEDHVATARKKYAKHKDKPTTAAGDPNLRLPEVLKQVDPKMISQVLPEMYNKLNQIRNLMISFNSQGGGGGSAEAPSGYAKTAIVDVFTGALCILCKEYSYSRVLTILFDVLGEDKYKIMGTEYQTIVFEAIVNIIKLADEFGEENIPVSTIPEVTYGSSVPTPLLASYTDVPDYYTQQYYRTELDPYPGYIEYMNDDGDKTYVRRRDIDYPFESSEKEIFTLKEYAFAADLDPYFKPDTLYELTVILLNTLLIEYCTVILLDTSEKNAGKNSNNDLLSMLTQFAGLAGTLMNSAKSNHLPQSVLDTSSMSKTLDEHVKNIGKIKKMKNMSAGAFDIGGLLNSGAVSSLQSMMSGKNNNVQQAASSILKVIS